jgi:hypothetical protein
MVNVRIDREWTDGDGAGHAAGDTVDIDAATLARLEADGVVTSKPGPGDRGNDPWPGETGTDPKRPGGTAAEWAGETGVQP